MFSPYRVEKQKQSKLMKDDCNRARRNLAVHMTVKRDPYGVGLSELHLVTLV
jgi:hypothetical protein